ITIMKKIRLSTGALDFATIASAQTVTIQYQTIDEATEGTPGTDKTGDEAVQMHNYVINESDAVIENLKFRLEEVDLPFGWSLHGFCNNITCFVDQIPGWVANNTGGPFAPIEVGDESLVEPRIYVPEYADDGIGTIKIKLIHFADAEETDIIQEETATFILRKGNVGV